MSETLHAHGAAGLQAAAMVRGDRRSNERRLWIAFALTAGFMVAELVGGVLTGSLALLADAGHMFNDAFALGVAVFAARVAGRPADSERSYGYGRIQVLAAFANAVGLVFIAIWIGVEAIRRLREPVEILSGPMLAIALGGLLVNLVALYLLGTANGRNLNIRGALLHVAGDVFGSVAAIVAAVLIMTLQWNAADPVLSFVVAVLIVAGTSHVLWESGHILLEGTPRGISNAEVVAKLRAKVPSITDVHDVHIWSLDSDELLITLHAVLAPGADRESALAAIQDHLAGSFAHATIQIEGGTCMLMRRNGTNARDY